MQDAIKEVVYRVVGYDDDAPFEVLSVRKCKSGNIEMVIHIKGSDEGKMMKPVLDDSDECF